MHPLQCRYPLDDQNDQGLDFIIRKINPKKIATGKYTVIVENRVAGNLMSPLFSSLSGQNLYQKQSFLADKVGRAVSSELLTIYDDPHLISGAGSRLFDGEGLAGIKRPIIENGILRNYYIDNYYGKKLNMQPTSGSSSNVLFTTGKRTLDEMIKSLNKGVLITGFNGGNFNGSTGDFSYGIEGFLIANGMIVHPVNEMNITGNMNQFWFKLAELGTDIMENRAMRIPSIMLRDVDLSGI